MTEPHLNPLENRINYQEELDFEADYRKLYDIDLEGVCLYV